MSSFVFLGKHSLISKRIKTFIAKDPYLFTALLAVHWHYACAQHRCSVHFKIIFLKSMLPLKLSWTQTYLLLLEICMSASRIRHSFKYFRVILVMSLFFLVFFVKILLMFENCCLLRGFFISLVSSSSSSTFFAATRCSCPGPGWAAVCSSAETAGGVGGLAALSSDTEGDRGRRVNTQAKSSFLLNLDLK